MTKHYTFTEAQRKTIVEWSRHNPDRCAKALENWIPSDDYETVKLALETERNAANLYAKQVAHWIEKHDALLAQQLETKEPFAPDACKTCKWHYKDPDMKPCNTCENSGNVGNNYEPRIYG